MQKRRWLSFVLILAFTLLFIPVNAMAMPATGTNYTTGDSVIALDAEITGTSTNDHTEAYKVWSKDDILYLAVSSFQKDQGCRSQYRSW